MRDKLTGDKDEWILDSEPSRYLVSNESWLDEVESVDDVCLQSNGDPLNVTKKDTLTLRVSASGAEKVTKLPDVYYATGVAHNLISYGKLE